ncbi:MAG: DUF2911 domain-containing protein [Ekhidna sp.]
MFGTILIAITCSNCANKKERPSPLRADSTSVGDTSIKLEYSSPSVRGREIFGIGSGYLVPYKSLWRTGANKSSSISINQDIIIDSTRVSKGTYSIFTIPDAKTWIVIFNKDSEQWGSTYYQDSLDVFRKRVGITRTKDLKEKMRFYIKNDSLKFEWEYIRWGIPVTSL